jgi:protein-disulfide isomerase
MTSRSRKSRQASQQRQRRQDRRRMIMIAAGVAAIVVVGLILVGGVFRGGSDTVTHSASTAGYILGDPAAPVVITAWEDFQCPICKAANASTLKTIEETYVSTGKAQLIFRQYPFLGAESYTASEASQCAADQDDFWDYHDALFMAQGAENSGTFSDAKLKEIASSLGLDAQTFGACLDSGQHKNSVAAEKAEGESLGVNSTPTIFVNGKQVADWRDYNAFAAMIEAALADTGG